MPGLKLDHVSKRGPGYQLRVSSFPQINKAQIVHPTMCVIWGLVLYPRLDWRPKWVRIVCSHCATGHNNDPRPNPARFPVELKLTPVLIQPDSLLSLYWPRPNPARFPVEFILTPVLIQTTSLLSLYWPPSYSSQLPGWVYIDPRPNPDNFPVEFILTPVLIQTTSRLSLYWPPS